MIKSNRRAVTLLARVAIVVGMATTAQAQQEGVYTIPSYKFEAGPQLDNVKIGYVIPTGLTIDSSVTWSDAAGCDSS